MAEMTTNNDYALRRTGGGTQTNNPYLASNTFDRLQMSKGNYMLNKLLSQKCVVPNFYTPVDN
jgi:hypothetical protein